ncbi:MAG: zinc-binding alcohol dehydrogenase family protein, partial [Mesorhizobium sp.]
MDGRCHSDRSLPWLAPAFDLAAGGLLRVTSGGRFPLDQAGAAHRLIKERRSTGKIVLVACRFW